MKSEPMALATGFNAASVTQLTPAASAASSRNQAFLSAQRATG